MTWYRQCQCPTTRAKLVLAKGENFDTPRCLNCDKAFTTICNVAKTDAFNNEDAEEPHYREPDDFEEYNRNETDDYQDE